jgi:ubiquinone/menaquinone biosynthesis C-methylase UbiE
MSSVTADAFDQVRAFYDQDPDAEWRRLDGRVQFRIEHLVTRHALARHLPPPAGDRRILDAGAGPGRYTIALAAQGYRVTLLDLSPGNVALARQKVAEASVGEMVDDYVVGSFTDLSRFADAQFEAVLCLGAAFSHVVDAGQRVQTLAEFTRVVKPGAPILVSAMNRLGALRGAVQWPTSWETDFPAGLATFAATGLSGDEAWPWYGFLPEEFVAELEGSGLLVDRLYGAQGLAAHLPPENLDALMADAERWPVWRSWLLATCDHPSVVGVSAHLLAAAHRTRSTPGSVPVLLSAGE